MDARECGGIALFSSLLTFLPEKDIPSCLWQDTALHFTSCGALIGPLSTAPAIVPFGRTLGRSSGERIFSLASWYNSGKQIWVTELFNLRFFGFVLYACGSLLLFPFRGIELGETREYFTWFFH